MKKKLISLALALSLACGLALPAAAQSAEERLGVVAAQVKATLGLDTGGYPEFYGELSEELLAPTWHLEWTGTEGSLSISATEEGKVLSYYHNGPPSTPASAGSETFAPTFPEGDRDSARAAALAFLDKILEEGESVTIEDRGSDSLNSTTYRFRGEILLNGLSAGLSYSITVRCGDNAVTNFYRDDLNGRVVDYIPVHVPQITQAQARKALRTTLALRLEYVLPQEGSEQAILRYLPEYGDEFYVDAETGELVNLSQLSRELEKGVGAAGGSAENESMDAAAQEPAAAPSFSQAEQAGIDKLEGVLSREELDKKARAITKLGLASYTLASADYSVGREEDDSVTVSLVYGKQVEGRSWRRTVILDAKSGELIRVYSSATMPDQGLERTVSQEQAQTLAQAFLKELCPAQLAKSQVYNSASAGEYQRRVSHNFTFAQKENGYFFPGNAISIGVDSTDGSISAYSLDFDDAITFQDPQGILTMEQALDVWLDTYTVELAYIQVPTAIDYSVPEYQPLLDYGVTFLYKLVLGYGLEREDYLLGVDAMSGQPAVPDWSQEQQGISYQDMSGHWAQAKVERLAKYGVGYYEERFQPEKALTQLDLVALLASTKGYRYESSLPGAADDLYEFAYDLGLLTAQERKDAALLTRAETVKVILDAVGYGHIAQLEGIFRTGFADDGDIPASYYGYAALAQGLGMVSGDADRFAPNGTATRAQAAVMLYQLMDR